LVLSEYREPLQTYSTIALGLARVGCEGRESRIDVIDSSFVDLRLAMNMIRIALAVWPSAADGDVTLVHFSFSEPTIIICIICSAPWEVEDMVVQWVS
jgi:hypothetical protein